MISSRADAPASMISAHPAAGDAVAPSVDVGRLSDTDWTAGSRATPDARPVVLVTGGAKRVGRVIAQRFARAGYRVAVHYGQSASDAHALVALLDASSTDRDVTGPHAVALQADLAAPSAAEALVDGCHVAFGRLDVLINSASVFPDDHLDNFTLETFDHAWAVNGRAPLLLIQAFYRRARAAGTTGVVINVVDQKVRDNFHPDHFSYTVGKVAIGHMTAMLATSAAPVLRINAVYPGLMLESGDQTPQDFAHARQHATPLHRIATPDDLAAAIHLLTGPAYNGVDWVVDGGQNLLPVTRDVVFSLRAPDR
ncbi:SDR family oxidoreductase [Robbsia andropogonis]|uniref:SDR family oxidoreductase n=1 Tax=Robbsia andropogonis TaxID=28092 RepID=UPI003D228F04